MSNESNVGTHHVPLCNLCTMPQPKSHMYHKRLKNLCFLSENQQPLHTFTPLTSLPSYYGFNSLTSCSLPRNLKSFLCYMKADTSSMKHPPSLFQTPQNQDLPPAPANVRVTFWQHSIAWATRLCSLVSFESNACSLSDIFLFLPLACQVSGKW